MITCEYTDDIPAVASLLCDPKCYTHMRNDAAPPLIAFTVKKNERWDAVLVKEDGIPVGLFLILPKSATAAEVHFSFMPSVWGRTLELARAFLQWTWANTAFERLIGPVPSYNRTCWKLALAAGFTQYDVQKDAGFKNGKSFDLHLTEINRPQSRAPQVPPRSL